MRLFPEVAPGCPLFAGSRVSLPVPAAEGVCDLIRSRSHSDDAEADLVAQREQAGRGGPTDVGRWPQLATSPTSGSTTPTDVGHVRRWFGRCGCTPRPRWSRRELASYCLQRAARRGAVFVAGSLFYAPSMAIFAIYNRHVLRTRIAEIPLKLWLVIALTSIIGGFAANAIYFYILKKHNSAIVAALTYSSPVFVLLFSMLVLQEPTHPVAVAGIMITVFGIALISYASHITHEDLEIH